MHDEHLGVVLGSMDKPIASRRGAAPEVPKPAPAAAAAKAPAAGGRGAPFEVIMATLELWPQVVDDWWE